MSNLAQELQPAQGLVVPFPKKERLTMTGIDEGYTRLPNLLIDSEIMADLSDKAFKCLLFILRQTIGFGRKSHSISTTQFQKYCGIKKEETVVKAIRELEKCKAIKVERKTGRLNEYFLTLNHYQQTVVPPSKGGSHTKQGESTTTQGGGSTPTEQGSIKENFKEKLNKNENKAPEQFSPQNRPMLQFIEYRLDDQQAYTLRELTQKYPAQSDFTAQAKISFPKLTDEQINGELRNLAQWSMTAEKRISQKWMTTWLNWLKNFENAQNKTQQKSNQPKAQKQQPKKAHRFGQGVINP